jgi:hypothetical protein
MLAVLTDMAVRARGALRAAWWAFTGLVVVVFAAWPSVWPGGGPAVPWGLIWYAPATPDNVGDVPSHPEYHWAGLQLFAGNLYLLAGLVVLAAALMAATGRPDLGDPTSFRRIERVSSSFDHMF